MDGGVIISTQARAGAPTSSAESTSPSPSSPCLGLAKHAERGGGRWISARTCAPFVMTKPWEPCSLALIYSSYSEGFSKPRTVRGELLEAGENERRARGVAKEGHGAVAVRTRHERARQDAAGLVRTRDGHHLRDSPAAARVSRQTRSYAKRLPCTVAVPCWCAGHLSNQNGKPNKLAPTRGGIPRDPVNHRRGEAGELGGGARRRRAMALPDPWPRPKRCRPAWSMI